MKAPKNVIKQRKSDNKKYAAITKKERMHSMDALTPISASVIVDKTDVTPQ